MNLPSFFVIVWSKLFTEYTTLTEKKTLFKDFLVNSIVIEKEKLNELQTFVVRRLSFVAAH